MRWARPVCWTRLRTAAVVLHAKLRLRTADGLVVVVQMWKVDPPRRRNPSTLVKYRRPCAFAAACTWAGSSRRTATGALKPSWSPFGQAKSNTAPGAPVSGSANSYSSSPSCGPARQPRCASAAATWLAVAAPRDAKPSKEAPWPGNQPNATPSIPVHALALCRVYRGIWVCARALQPGTAVNLHSRAPRRNASFEVLQD